MANIKFSRKRFEKDFGKLDEKTQNNIAMFGTPVESFTDNEIEIEVFPNRPDLLSYHGFKRSFLSFTGKKKGLMSYKLNKPEKDYVVNIDKSVNDVRGFTACAIVKGLNFDDDKIKEIIDIQEKLHSTIGRKRKKLAIGVYPLEKIKLPIYYKALEPDKIRFVPLEASREMSGLEILQRHPTGRDYAPLLAGKTKFPVFIDADKNILSMPPIINSQLTGKVDERTKDIFVECSGFDFEILNKCLNILITALADMGGKVYQMELKYQGGGKITPNLNPEKMKISLENTNKLLGLNLKEKEMKDYLEKMGHNYNKGVVEIGAWRTDILHEVDLIEDIAIGYGYENFIPEIPEIAMIGKENFKETVKRKIAEILSGLNCLEISNYHLTKKQDQFTKMGVAEKQEAGFIEVENSKTDYTILRKDLTHYLLKIFAENVDAEYPQKVFELGRVFNLENDITESEKLSLGFTPGNFTDVKQALEYLFRMLDVNIKIEEAENFPNYFIDGRVAKIILDKEEIGFLGEVHPRILRSWKIKMPVALCEINLDRVFEKF